MVDAVRNVSTRYVTACVTNNMRLGYGTAMAPTQEAATGIAEVMTLFDRVFESWRLGTRKPEVRFFEHACVELGVEPRQCVYLDDLGINLKPARAMGMTTIKVGDPEKAIDELEAILGHRVRS